MDEAKRQVLESAGYRVGDAEDFLGPDLSGYSYTAATGKRPKMLHEYCYRWTLPDPPSHQAPENLPDAVFDRLEADPRAYPQRWLFRTSDAALKAADEAYLKAVADGAIKEVAS